MLQNLATQFAKVQERTHLSTDYQTDKQIHPSVKFTIKFSTKVSPTKPADAKIKKLNITPGYTSWLQRKTTEIGTVTLVKLQSVKFSIKINTKVSPAKPADTTL